VSAIIRQFDYGIQKVKAHFPTARFTTYSAEEPMFTSALPGILKSFGFEYAVFKNPNTCWGGYTRAFGGELINWIGLDSTKITTVPRYAIESLQPGSTWQTIASEDSTNYIEAAFKAGIKHPIGMCYQDAGWRFGPWMDHVNQSSYTVIYETWRNYFQTISTKTTKQDWPLSQEDILVSLVWGSQILQQIAQEVRSAENKIVAAEALAAMAKYYSGIPWPKSSLDEAWRTLLLSEHHDCWIVPYNLHAGSTWAQHVAEWTGSTGRTSDEVMQKSMSAFVPISEGENLTFVRVFNNLGVVRRWVVSVPLPPGWDGSPVRVLNAKNEEILSQVIRMPNSEGNEVLLRADVASLGYNSYQLQKAPASSASGANLLMQADGTYKIETDLYKIVLDPSKGGTIKSLVAKALENKEFVDSSNTRRFDEIRGYFYSDGGFHSSADGSADINVLENGPLRVRVAIKGTINSQSFLKVISVAQGQKAIDLDLKIDWKGSPGIGAKYGQTEPFEATNNTKAFYDDRYKLIALFPSKLGGQKIFKNAPFDVTESKLTNTFFTSWDGIKNNVVLNWVDVTDTSEKYGLALLTDHTTSYTHGVDFPLGLTLQYSGTGLWGRNYRIAGPTEVHYALIPHSKKWGMYLDRKRQVESAIGRCNN
jgi:alpha-mannosidase